MNKVRMLVVTFLAGALAVPGLAAPRAFAASSGAGPVTDVSSACAGQNAEVEQAVAPPHYVYEAWIGCGGEGFARSTDGGAHFSKPITLPDSSGSDDPAVAVAPDGTVYVSYLRYHRQLRLPGGGGLLRPRGELLPGVLAHPARGRQLGRPGLHRRRTGRHGLRHLGLRAERGGREDRLRPVGQLRLQRGGRHRGGPEVHGPREDLGTDHPDAAGLPGGRRLRRFHRCPAQRGGRRPDTGSPPQSGARSPCIPGTNCSPRPPTAARRGRPRSRSGAARAPSRTPNGGSTAT